MSNNRTARKRLNKRARTVQAWTRILNELRGLLATTPAAQRRRSRWTETRRRTRTRTRSRR